MRFASQVHFQAWIAVVEDIKARIDAINARRNDRIARFGSEDPVLERAAHIQWLGHVQRFRRGQRADNFVPWDIRSAVNDVEQGVGLPATQWNLRLA